MKNKDFDVELNIEVKIRPVMYEDTATQIERESIEAAMKWQARLLANGLEKYFENLIKERIQSMEYYGK
jgi:hypothetical protein